MLKLTIAQRLWLGLGLIMAFFAIADLISLRAANSVDVALKTLVSSGDERRGAGFDMRTELAAMVAASQHYLKDRDPTQRARVNKSEKAFEQALGSYKSTAAAERSRALGVQVDKAYARFKHDNREVMRLKDVRAVARTTLAAHQGRIDALLSAMPLGSSPARQSPFSPNGTQINPLEGALRAAAFDVESRMQADGEAFERRMAGDRALLDTALAQYKKAAKTPSERIWAEQAERWSVELTRSVGAFLKADALYERGLDQAKTSATRLEDILIESIQPAARAELAAAVEQASGIAHHANVLITRGLLLALLLGALAAIATVRAVKAPLRRVVESIRRLAEGDFSHRMEFKSRDELGALIGAFNEMVEKLQTTTVSRSYLQSIVESMGEALIVVSHGGCIQTANPAAEQLLGYGVGELSGQPLSAVVSAGGAAAAACTSEIPMRVNDELVHKQGFPIPVALSTVPLPIQQQASGAVVCIAQDLRDRLQAERHQRQATVVFENTTEGIILTDAQRRILLVNPAFCEITGYTMQEVQGLPSPQLWSDEKGASAAEPVWQAVLDQGHWQGELWIRCKDGALRPVWKNVTAVHDSSGRVTNFVAVFSDISAVKDAEERLNFLAYHDALTHLPNRLLLAERLRLALNRAQHSGRSVALLYLDLDDFKHVNDTLGHETGDVLLREMAQRLSRALDANDTVARLGGDEFIVVLEDLAQVEQAAEVADQLLNAICAPFALGGLELRMTASIGISVNSLHDANPEDLLKSADAAMYRAKSVGGAGYQFFSPELTERAMEQLTVKNALRHPKLDEQLIVHYQPQISIETGRIVGVEALVRWQHPTRGLLSPGQFIPIAEQAGLVHTIGEFVLKRACAQAKTWQERGYLPLRIGINVTAQELASDAIVKRVECVLHESGLPASLLELEVTESALQVEAGVVEVLQRLKALGVRLALDDFGTGYSSLGSIKCLPLDRLKIDRSFIRDLQYQAADRSLVRAIISMGRALNLEIIAEGVETATQLNFLRDAHCDEVQGYLLGKPMSAVDFDRSFPDRIVTTSLRKPQRIHSLEIESSLQTA